MKASEARRIADTKVNSDKIRGLIDKAIAESAKCGQYSVDVKFTESHDIELVVKMLQKDGFKVVLDSSSPHYVIYKIQWSY